jgi:hypothetical protein
MNLTKESSISALVWMAHKDLLEVSFLDDSKLLTQILASAKVVKRNADRCQTFPDSVSHVDLLGSEESFNRLSEWNDTRLRAR